MLVSRLAVLSALVLASVGCTPDDRPDDAEVRIAEANARAADAEARAAAAQAELAMREAGDSTGAASEPPKDGKSPAPDTPPDAPEPPAPEEPPSPPSEGSRGSYAVPPRPGPYTGSYTLTGTAQLCHTHERATVRAYRGMELCYEIALQQAEDGRLTGSGRKVTEETRGTGFRDLPASEQTPITVRGYIADGEEVHLEYTVQGARRTTRGVAVYRPTDREQVLQGTFRTDAARASGPARLFR